ncbi:MAG: hypothetical protein NTV51_29675 [Verrucomicrobia bacterium]|nr:hypothetical protein [Verrucomicrobiota bacterium]
MTKYFTFPAAAISVFGVVMFLPACATAPQVNSADVTAPAEAVPLPDVAKIAWGWWQEHERGFQGWNPPPPPPSWIPLDPRLNTKPDTTAFMGPSGGEASPWFATRFVRRPKYFEVSMPIPGRCVIRFGIFFDPVTRDSTIQEVQFASAFIAGH